MKGLIIIPFVDCYQENRDALRDALAQLDSGTEVLLIDQGSTDTDVRRWALDAAVNEPRVRLWRHAPSLPSLAATWNHALDYAWETGHQDAMVWNNDVRVAPRMYDLLRQAAIRYSLWFTTPVNCAGGASAEAAGITRDDWQTLPEELPPLALGGPDFSCFLISKGCHGLYRFDERFQPAYHEDGDFHRRMWLNGNGGRIAGVTLPYLHYGSRTIQRSEAAQVAFAPQFAACRGRYVAKWGGEPHHETKVSEGPALGLLQFDNVGTPGGYLNGAYPAIAAEARCVSCGSAGFEKRVGLRAFPATAEQPTIAKFFGCAFCSGADNNEPDGGSIG